MKFLKKLFKRSSGDDDDDFDDDDFDFDDDDDDASTTVIMDDDDFGNDDESLDGDFGGDVDGDLGGNDDLPDDEDDEEGGSIQNDQLAALEAQMAGDDEALFGTDSSSDDGDDGYDGAAEGDDDEDFDFGDDELDYDDDDWDDDDEDGEGGGDRRKKLIFIGAAVGVLVLGIAGGAAFWLMGDDEQTAQAPPSDGRIQMALPPKAGSLNAVDVEGGETPAEGSGETSAETSAESSGETLNASLGAQSDGQQAAAESGQAAGAASETTLTTPDVAGGSLNALAGAASGAQGLVVPSVTSTSYRRTADLEKGVPLAAAPIKALLENVDGQSKPLPKIDSRGGKPWEAYARPLKGNEQGQHVAIMVTGLGLSRAATMAAIRKLPPEVSLVFEPYASDLEDWLLRARLAGHEVFVSLPMESGSFPNRDAGPMALTTTIQVADNIKRLHSVLSSFGGYVGVVSSMGSKFSTADGQLKPILEEIKRRGLIFVDAARSSKSSAPTIAQEIDLPVLKNNVVLDDPPSSGSIQRKLRNLEAFISKNATAIATARPYPVSIHQVQAWIKTLAEKKLVLVPVSSVVGKQFIE